MRVYRQRLFDAISQRFGDVDPQQLRMLDFALGPQKSFAYLRQLAEGGE